MTNTMEERGAEAASPGPRLILVVDDDPGMRSLFEIYLGSIGFRVVLSANGSDAMEMIAHHPDICLIVMDVVMSGLSGVHLADEARIALPGVAILFCSGHAPKELARFGLGHLSEAEFVQKPCAIADLRRKIEGCLAAARPVAQAVPPLTREDQGERFHFGAKPPASEKFIRQPL